MDESLVTRIENDPKYQELKSKRSKLGWTLAIAMLIVYYGFTGLVAFDKSLLAQRIGGGVTTIGIPLGMAVIAFTIIVTGIYVSRANREFDRLNDEVIARAGK